MLEKAKDLLNKTLLKGGYFMSSVLQGLIRFFETEPKITMLEGHVCL